MVPELEECAGVEFTSHMRRQQSLRTLSKPARNMVLRFGLKATTLQDRECFGENSRLRASAWKSVLNNLLSVTLPLVSPKAIKSGVAES